MARSDAAPTAAVLRPVGADAPGHPAAAVGWAQAARLGIESLAGLIQLHREIWTVVDVPLADLCRRRIAQLLRAPRFAEWRAAAVSDAPTVGEVTDWPRATRFAAHERAALAFTEQFVLDVGAVDQPHVDGLLEHLTPGECYALVNAIWVFEATLRALLVLGVDVAPEQLGLVEV